MRLHQIIVMFALVLGSRVDAEDLTTKWSPIVVGGSRSRQTVSIPENARYRSLPTLSFKGPGPQHPFLLDEFAATGEWRLSPEGVVPDARKNAALLLATGDELEIEGRMVQSGHGGWFILVGWSEGSGYLISSFSMRVSGSPWFLTAIRNREPVPGIHKELPAYEWKGEQAFRLSIKNKQLTMKVGREYVFAREKLEGYQPGAVVLGVYDTRYGQKPITLRSLRARAFSPTSPKAPAAGEGSFSRTLRLPTSFLAIDTECTWAGEKNLPFKISLKEAGRVKILGVDPVTGLPTKSQTILERFDPEPVALSDGSEAWRCEVAFDLGDNRPTVKALVGLAEEGDVFRFATRMVRDADTGAVVNSHPASFDDEFIATVQLQREVEKAPVPEGATPPAGSPVAPSPPDEPRKPRRVIAGAILAIDAEPSAVDDSEAEAIVGDLSVKQKWGTLRGGKIAKAGPQGNAIRFTATEASVADAGKGSEQQVLDFGQQTKEFPLRDFTITVWAQPKNDGVICGSGQQELWPRQWFLSRNQFSWASQPGRSSGAVGRVVNAVEFACPLSRWSHLAIRRQGSEVVAFVNGREVAKNNSFPTAPLPLYGNGLMIGNMKTDGGRFVRWQPFGGMIDELVIWDSALSSEEISRIYRDGKGNQSDQQN